MEALGQLEEGLRLKQQALERDPFSPLVHLQIPPQWNQHGYDQAIVWANKALSSTRVICWRASSWPARTGRKAISIGSWPRTSDRRNHSAAQRIRSPRSTRGCEEIRRAFDAGGRPAVTRYMLEQNAAAAGRSRRSVSQVLHGELGDLDAAFESSRPRTRRPRPRCPASSRRTAVGRPARRPQVQRAPGAHGPARSLVISCAGMIHARFGGTVAAMVKRRSTEVPHHRRRRCIPAQEQEIIRLACCEGVLCRRVVVDCCSGHTALLATILALVSCACATTGQAPDRGTVDAAIRARTTQGIRVEAEAPMPPDVTVDDGLTSEEAVAIALWNSPSFQATLADLGIARADLVEAGLLRNPVFSFALSARTQAARVDAAVSFRCHLAASRGAWPPPDSMRRPLASDWSGTR